MHLISEHSDHLGARTNKVSEAKMISKKDMSLLESILLLQAVEQHSGKRKASEALNTSVDTINKYLDNLEQDLGVKLLSTSGRGSTLTGVARRIVDKASRIKEVIDEIYHIRLENREIKGEVRVFMSLGYASYMIPQDLSPLFDIFPELSINSVTAIDVSSLNAQEIDVAVTYEEINDDDIVLIAEKTVHCGFFASSEYLSQKGYPLNIEDLVQNHRLLSRYEGMLKKVLGPELFNKAKICFTSNNTLSLINAIENSAGVGIMPLSFALQGLVCLDNIPCNSPVTYHLYANRHTKDIPRVRTMINFYKDIMDKLENPVPVPSMSGDPLPIIRRLVNG